jgi:hypothetical protein
MSTNLLRTEEFLGGSAFLSDWCLFVLISVSHLPSPEFSRRSSQKSFRSLFLTTNPAAAGLMDTNLRETEDHPPSHKATAWQADGTDVRKMRNPNDEEREPTNHANRREKKSEAKITEPFRAFGVFRGQIAFIRGDRHAGRGALRQPVVLTMSADPIPNEAAAFKFANGTIMDATATLHLPRPIFLKFSDG